MRTRLFSNGRGCAYARVRFICARRHAAMREATRSIEAVKERTFGAHSIFRMARNTMSSSARLGFLVKDRLAAAVAAVSGPNAIRSVMSCRVSLQPAHNRVCGLIQYGRRLFLLERVGSNVSNTRGRVSFNCAPFKCATPARQSWTRAPLSFGTLICLFFGGLDVLCVFWGLQRWRRSKLRKPRI